YLPDRETLFPTDQLPLVRALRGESLDDVELYVRRPGSAGGIFLNVTGRPLRDPDGKIYGGVVVFHDITNPREAEWSLRASEERFGALTESANDAIISADANGRIMSWNQGAKTIFGYAEGEVLGQQISVLMPESFRELHRRGFARFQTTGVAYVIG